MELFLPKTVIEINFNTGYIHISPFLKRYIDRYLVSKLIGSEAVTQSVM